MIYLYFKKYHFTANDFDTKKKYLFMKQADYLIDYFQMTPHPEGGFYKEIFKSDKKIEIPAFDNIVKQRFFQTSIYFLLKENQISNFHRLKSDEIWFFHEGSSVVVHTIDIQGNRTDFVLGSNLANSDSYQVILPAGTWFAAKNIDQNSYSFFSCTVSPGFDFEDFDLGNFETLSKLFPEHLDLIRNFVTQK